MRCPAKLNLSLHVLGRRQDGYSELDSVVALLDWADDLFIEVLNPCPSPDSALPQDLIFTSNDPYMETLGEANLVIKAIRAVQNTVQKQSLETQGATLNFPTVRVHLDKHLPYQAGLGSASSDAATALLLYHQRLVETLPSRDFQPLSDACLKTLGAGIGSDVPLFLEGVPLLRMQGRGERITPFSSKASVVLDDIVLLVIKSESLHISTAEAFRRLHEAQTYSLLTHDLLHALEAPKAPTAFDALLPLLKNDFEAVSVAQYPLLEAMKTALTHLGAFHTLLCGSGSAVVGFFHQTKTPSLEAQASLAKRFEAHTWVTSFQTR
jgi:4-diphosphocytidyl-2-C-methyl-D-erythritol kinase